MSSLERLFDRVERLLGDNSFATDRILMSRICVAFCDLLRDELTNEQRAAVEDARLYLNGQLSESARLETNARMASGLDEIHRSGDGKSKREAVQRLAWIPVGNTEGLSAIVGEFLVGLGDRAGLTAEQMEEVFVRVLPGF